MSIFWDPRNKRPQLWIYPFFIILTLILFFAVYYYGANKAASIPESADQGEGG